MVSIKEPAEMSNKLNGVETFSPSEQGIGDRLVTVFSSSRLDAYTRCPAQYYFKYVAKVPDNGVLSSSLAFDRCLKAAIYAEKGYEPDNVPFEEQWRPELCIAADAFSEGKQLDEVFAETFRWLEDEDEIEWKDETEFDEMLRRGCILARMFHEEFDGLSGNPFTKMRTTMVDKENGKIVLSNGIEAFVVSYFDVIGDDGVIYKLKTSAKSTSRLEYDWALDLQRYVHERVSGQAPAGLRVVNLVRTKQPKMQVLDAPEPRISRTLAICESVIASINAKAFYPNPKNLYGCSSCSYRVECENEW